MSVDLGRFAQQAACIFAVSLLGGLVPLLRRWSQPQLQTLLSLSAGIILGVLFFDLLPHNAGMSPHFHTLALAGFMLMLALEKFVFIHPHETDELAGRRSGIAAYLGISLHSLLDGFALGSSTLAPQFAPGVAFAILAHKLPDTFSLSTILTYFRFSRRSTMLLLVLFSLLTPLGGVVALLTLRGLAPAQLGGVIAIASGTFLFIATSDLLPHAHAHHTGRYRNLAAVVVGLAITYVVYAVSDIH